MRRIFENFESKVNVSYSFNKPCALFVIRGRNMTDFLSAMEIYCFMTD